MVIGYGGSQSPGDFLADALFLPTEFKAFDPDLDAPAGVQIHSGFDLQFKSTRETILGIVNELLDGQDGARVLATGHSLGGAMAVVLAYEWLVFGRTETLATQARWNNNFGIFDLSVVTFDCHICWCVHSSICK